MATTTHPVQIQPAARRRSIATLARAFSDDPVMRWVWPNAEAYAAHWPRFAEALGGRAFDHGTAFGLADYTAVALWLPPGIGPDEEAFLAVLGASMDGPLLAEALTFVEQMDGFHPSGDHWYLPLTGVDPPAQGRGLGSALLRHALERCDRDGLPAYLEATTARSRDLYARHGFEVMGVIQAGASPPMWPMLRQ